MKKTNLTILSIFISILITACGSGAPRGISDNAYGNLKSFSQITMGGEPSNTPIPVNVLQDRIASAVCPGIIPESALVIANNIAGGTLAALLCADNQTQIESMSYLGGLDIKKFIESNSLGITGANLYQITYNTQGQPYYYSGGAVTNETVSGLVVMPQGIAAESIKGIVLFYHGTAFSKNGVPSMQDTGTQYTLASIYASQGYIAIAPDYVGQGINAGVMHPYVLYAQTNALSGLNMLTATRQFLAQNNLVAESKSLNLYLTSYSEGGAYAVWGSRLLQNENASILAKNNLNLKLTVGISGAYDLSGSMIPYAYDNSNNSQQESLNYYNASPGIFESSPYYVTESNPIAESAHIPPYIQQGYANLNIGTSKAALASYAFVSFITYNYTPTAYPLFFANDDFFNMKSCLNLPAFMTGNNITDACPITDSLPNLFMNYGNAFYESIMARVLVAYWQL